MRIAVAELIENKESESVKLHAHILCLCKLFVTTSWMPVSFLCCAYVTEKIIKNGCLRFCVLADAGKMCSCHAPSFFSVCVCVYGAVGVVDHVCVIVTYWMYPWALFTPVQWGLLATHLSSWSSLLATVILIGTHYQTPVGAHASLVQSRFEGGLKMKAKEVCECVWGCYWWDWSVSWLMCHFGMIHELRDVWRNDKCSCVHFCAICLHVFTFLFVFVNLWTVWLRVLAHVCMCGGVCECVVWVCLSSCLFK